MKHKWSRYVAEHGISRESCLSISSLNISGLTPFVEPRNFLSSLAMLSASGSFSSMGTTSGSTLDPDGFEAANLAAACILSASPVLILRRALDLPDEADGGFRGG